MNYNWSWSVFLEMSPDGVHTFLETILIGVGWTLALALTAWVFSLLLGSWLGVMRTVQSRLMNAIGATYVELFRNIPLLVQMFLWYFVLPELLPHAWGLAMKQMPNGCGPIFAFHLDGGRKQAHGLLDALALIDISNNIGDSRSLMTHPASTTHASVSAENQREMGIDEGMLRLNVGLEDPQDLIDDLDSALRSVGL